MKWIKDMLSDATKLLQAPLSNTLCVAGLMAVLGAFCDYSKAQGFSLRGHPHLFMLLVGIGLIFVGVLVFILLQKGWAHTKLDYTKGVQIVRAGFTINLKTAEIQAITDTTKNAAIILPANTSFIDDCVTDNRSALGAFFLQHFPDRIASLQSVLREVLDERRLSPDVKGQYPPGTTIVLPDQFSNRSFGDKPICSTIL